MMQSFCDWLSGTWVSLEFAELQWFVPAVQTIHILAIAALVTMIAMLNFRILRITRRGLTLEEMNSAFMPWIWRALATLAITGALLTVVEPERELMSNMFRLKMLLVLLLAGVTYGLAKSIRKDSGRWTTTPLGRAMARGMAVFGSGLCLSIVVAGRLIAYV
jgi:hypothetical protein